MDLLFVKRSPQLGKYSQVVQFDLGQILDHNFARPITFI